MWFYKVKHFYILFIFIMASLMACGFKPLHSEFTNNKNILGSIEVLEIVGKEGYHVREDLVRRFGDPKEKAFLLDISLETSKINEVITRTNEITSYRLIMKATYSLKNHSGELLIPRQTSVARTGYRSASNSTGYTTQVAEKSAKKRLALKIGEKINTRLLILGENWLK